MKPEKQWILQNRDSESIQRLQSEQNCSEVLARILVNRGIETGEQARSFFDPTLSDLHDPRLLPDLKRTVKRIRGAINNDESIVIYSDRDVDGITGSAILLRTLQLMGVQARSYIPDKKAGYGLNETAIKSIANNNNDLLITVDCGTTALQEIKLAMDSGLDVIVTDHHELNSDTLPEATVINPKRPDSKYPNRELSGGAVAFKLARELIEHNSNHDSESFLNMALPLAGLSTLGDYMVLNPENRALIKLGFDRIKDTGLEGLSWLVDRSGIESIRDLQWSLLPLLNAAQEDKSGHLMLDTLLTENRSDFESMLSRLEEFREKRKQNRQERQEHLKECFENQSSTHNGDFFFVQTEKYVGGFALHQLSEEWGRPMIAYRPQNGKYRGGGRTGPDFDFIDLYRECDDLLDQYWGHPGAAGFRIKKKNFDKFQQKVLEYVQTHYSPEDFGPAIEVDAEVSIEQIDEDFLSSIERLQPFGNGNPEPKFFLREVAISDVQKFGDEDQHLKLIASAKNGLSLIDWNFHKEDRPLDTWEAIDLVGTLEFDNYAGKPVINIKDFSRTGQKAVK